MTLEQLVAEGRSLERPCVFLRKEGTGPAAAIWYERNQDEVEGSGEHCWLTVDRRHVPGVPDSIGDYLCVFSDEESCVGGRIDFVSAWPTRSGTELFAHPANVLPPIDAVFARGSDAVGEWLAANGWQREWRYNNNFKDRELVNAYEKVWRSEFPPLFTNSWDSEIYAILAGWHCPGQDDDWHDLIDEQLMVLTVRDSEPWVEAWHMRNGEFRVIQRTS